MRSTSTTGHKLVAQRSGSHEDLELRSPATAEDRALLSQRLLQRAAQTDDPVERKRLQDEVVVLHMGLARAIAARYRGRGIADEDLTQAAAMALLKCARNFDASKGVEFLSYAVVTMKGEVKRQFRDYGWMVRPPRPIQKLQAEIPRAQAELTHQLGRSPRVKEVAAHLGAREDDIVEALSADGCYSPMSLDAPVGEGGSGVLGDLFADQDSAMSEAEARIMLAPAVRALPEREREILYLRFFRQQTQAEIAEEIGSSQMQVSRTLARVLAHLRGRLG
ncbi:MAG: polymerase sigma-B factor [Nocardioidaceae bacterium]|jgi:RNA polymerase sigma-B factor|nr:polymerase sigma-B factor [Nocardioidaceae bacterium]